MKVWITKYALTQGIIETDVEFNPEFPTMVCLKARKDERYYFDTYYHKPYWYTSLEEANAHILKLIDTKIKSINKVLEKMRKLRETYSPTMK